MRFWLHQLTHTSITRTNRIHILYDTHVWYQPQSTKYFCFLFSFKNKVINTLKLSTVVFNFSFINKIQC